MTKREVANGKEKTCSHLSVKLDTKAGQKDLY